MRRSVPFFRVAGIVCLGVLIAAPFAALERGPIAAADAADKGRVFEQRVYFCNSGLLDDLHARFRNHTNYLFVKHGMSLIGYWTPVDEKDTLVYILAYPSQEAREKSWQAFRDDPVWKAVFAASREKAGGALVKKVESTFLRPTDYSPIR